MKNLSVGAKRQIALMVFLLSPLAFGAYDLFAYEEDSQLAGSALFSIVVGIVSIMAWCSFDAEIQNYQISKGLRFGILLLAIVAVPVYLVQARGWQSALKIGLGLPAFLVSVGTYYLGWFVAYGIAKSM